MKKGMMFIGALLFVVMANNKGADARNLGAAAIMGALLGLFAHYLLMTVLHRDHNDSEGHRNETIDKELIR